MTENTSQQLPAVAFLGLGHMGGPMAANLVKAGVRVTGYDIVPEACAAAREAGIEVVETPQEAVQAADVVITMFPSGKHVVDAYTGVDGAEGLLAAAPAGATFLDCSTINISEAQDAARLAQDAGFTAADAPVSGGVVGATAGTLAFMVGGDPEVFERVRPLLEIMGGRVVHCGGNGMGQAAKICNNMILGVSMVAVSEAFVLAEKLGLEHQAMYDVVSNASGQCWALTTNCPVPGPVPTSPANKDYEPGFAGALMAKDLNLAATALDQTGATAPMGRLAAELYNQFVADGHAGKDFSGIITTLRDGGRQSSREE
ncbi:MULTISPECIES: 3-hydroxyisobutyrate dehydrogenase [Kocuria]|uniref:3-hydroxyisobutyrate dehydrogenase n=1 Tax=Kocuria varians TaxID=1272 RepID=A0A7D7KZQ0_KOCVA|nr:MULTISPECIES: 3-hydroxyisobutyrate dehydrogenase [Kocuria]MDN5631785.1 3-hydroxyisobutyrate dehydrogenase [Kocuria sp.]QMS56726.1 putative 3-hydroxyisobutyrate dehydrogenase [Kocuria varians]